MKSARRAEAETSCVFGLPPPSGAPIGRRLDLAFAGEDGDALDEGSGLASWVLEPLSGRFALLPLEEEDGAPVLRLL